MKAQKLIDTARTLVAGDKGLLGGVMGGTASSVSSSRYNQAARRGEYNAAMEKA
jgi:hypothetical protein